MTIPASLIITAPYDVSGPHWQQGADDLNRKAKAHEQFPELAPAQIQDILAKQST